MNIAHIDPNPDIKFKRMKSGAKSSTITSSIKHESGHVSPFNFYKLFNPDASSWDKLFWYAFHHWVTIMAISWIITLDYDEKGILEMYMELESYERYDWIVVNKKVAVLIFLLISSGIVYGYYAIILKIDEEDFGGHGPLLQEGLFASVTLFLLAWTLVYSLGF
ncbi:Rab5-interacting protein [Tanacetum coccineum]